MKKSSLASVILIIVSGIFCSLSGCSGADPTLHAFADPQARREAKAELNAAISLDSPPYIMENGTAGLEVELVRLALPEHSIQFKQVPLAEVQTAIQTKLADVSVCVKQGPVDAGVFYSDNFVAFSNYAITKKAERLVIDSVADLANHPVLAWQKAYLELGESFEEMFSPGSPQRKNYFEYAQQEEQVKAFWQGSGKIAVIDRNIFKYFSKQSGHPMDEVSLHPIFAAETEFKVGFKDAALRDRFNQGLQSLCQDGEYARLLKKYEIISQETVCGGDEKAVEAAVAGFYAALNTMFTGDLQPMKEVWSHADDVTYMGPDGGFNVGWNKVLANWQGQADMKLGGSVAAEKMKIVVGSRIAVTHNYEKGENSNVDGTS
ncbi:MAG: transporter substrate-binding domain-containing protein, partial [Planctomycetales bacterium]